MRLFSKPKYSSKRTVVNGSTFDSKAEAAYYIELALLLDKGDLISVELHPKVYLTTSRILYKPDFKIKDKFDRVWYVDVKGFETPVFKIKKRLWKHYGDGCLRLVKKSGSTFKLVEEVISSSCGL